MSESEAIDRLESIAKKDLQHALDQYLMLCDENPHAEGLLQKFYDTLLQMNLLKELLRVSGKRLKRISGCRVSFLSNVKALQHMNRKQEAMALLEAAATRDPENIVNLNALGSMQKSAGDVDAAQTSFNKVVKLNPTSAVAHWNRASFSQDPARDLAAVRKLISDHQTPEEQAHFLHFTAHRYCEKLGLYEDAFEHLHIANAMKRRTLDYDVEHTIDIDQQIKSIFTPARMQSLTPTVASELTPIFIMGMPGSGTTLVKHVISRHTQVAAGDQYTTLANTTRLAQRRAQFDGSEQDWLASRQAQHWSRIGKLYEHNMRFVRGNQNAFTDQHQFNHRHVGVIKACFSNAKIVFVERDVMASAFDCYRQLFNDQEALFSYQFDEIARAYASHTKLMDYWETVTSDLILRVRYEDLIHNQQSTTDRLLDFCGLNHEPDCYGVHQEQALDRWKQYQRPLQPLLDALKEADLA